MCIRDSPIAVLAGALLATGCSSEFIGDNNGKEQTSSSNILQADQVQSYLKGLKVGDGLIKGAGPVGGNPIEVGDPVEEQGERDVLNGIPGYWVKKTHKYTLNSAFNETILLDPSSDIIYPGCAIKGNTIGDGTYAAISNCELGDITFSINLSPVNNEDKSLTKKTVHNIRKSDYQDALNDWANINFKEGSQITLSSVDKINNQAELIAKLGAAVKSSIVDVSTSFGFNFSKKKNHILAKVIQKTFTVTTDFPKTTPTIFQKVDKNYFEDCQPVYVSSINYGRILYLCIDTDDKEKDVKQALDFAIKKIKGTDFTVEGNDEVKYRKILSSCNMHVTMLGGGQTMQSEILNADLDAVKRFLNQKLPINEMHPVSFSLRFAVDNSVARVQPSNTYTVTQKDFVQDFKHVRVILNVTGIEADGGNSNPALNKYAILKGSLGIKEAGKEEKELWNAENQAYLYYHQGIRKFESPEDVYLELRRGEKETVETMQETRYVEIVSHLRNKKRGFGGEYKKTIKLSLAQLFNYMESQEPIKLKLGTGNDKWVNVYINVKKITCIE